MKNRNAGLGLIEVLIAIGILGIVAVGISKMSNNMFRMQKKASVNDERLALFGSIRKSLSCEKTFELLEQTYGECGSHKDQAIKAYRSSEKEFISNTGTKMGNWAVKAFCRDKTGIEVRVAYIGSAGLDALKDGSGIYKDAITGAQLDFDHPQNKISPMLCSDAEDSSGSTEPDLECVTASRTGSNIVASKPNVVVAFDSGVVGTETMKWGMKCGEKYNRMSCSMNTPTKTPGDSDIVMMDRGCASDNDEWENGHSLQMVCCKLKK